MVDCLLDSLFIALVVGVIRSRLKNSFRFIHGGRTGYLKYSMCGFIFRFHVGSKDSTIKTKGFFAMGEYTLFLRSSLLKIC